MDHRTVLLSHANHELLVYVLFYSAAVKIRDKTELIQCIVNTVGRLVRLSKLLLTCRTFTSRSLYWTFSSSPVFRMVFEPDEITHHITGG